MEKYMLPTGKELIIREARKSDAQRLIDYVNAISYESDFLTFGPGEFNIPIEKEERFIEESYNTKNKLFLVAQIQGRIVGNLSFAGGQRPRIKHSGEFGISVLKEYWGQGIGSRLILYLIQWCKESGEIRKVNLSVREDNVRAIKLYERLGFKKEGKISRTFYINGQFYAAIVMGLEID